MQIKTHTIADIQPDPALDIYKYIYTLLQIACMQLKIFWFFAVAYSSYYFLPHHFNLFLYCALEHATHTWMRV
jgi:hypothetical protein